MRKRGGLALATVVIAALVALSMEGPAPRKDAASAVAVTATAVALDARDPAQRTVGSLTYRGGVEMTSDDPRFGGLSGLHVSEDGRQFLAVSDDGYGVAGTLEYDAAGLLGGVRDVSMRPLMGLDGRPLPSKRERDAEALVRLDDSRVVVGFESRDRLWTYAEDPPFSGPPIVIEAPAGLADVPRNGGIESVAALADGRLLVLAEELEAGEGAVRGWVGRSGEWSPLAYAIEGPARPCDATRLPDGDLLVLERSYSPLAGVAVTVRRIAAASVMPGATLRGTSVAVLRPPLTADNFEGVSARTGPGREVLVYLVSDDNFNPLQRTLLLMFALDSQALKGVP